jgi:hypothetical protein
MPAYMNIDATKHNGTTSKTQLADFGIERTKRDTLTEAQIAAYARRKSDGRKQYEQQQESKRGK